MAAPWKHPYISHVLFIDFWANQLKLCVWGGGEGGREAGFFLECILPYYPYWKLRLVEETKVLDLSD